MAPSDDLKAHAASNQDFYTLLNISPAASDAEIRRAYRRTALKYHPDKIANPTQADIDKFHLLQIANDVLSDPAVRQLYDNAREAGQRKQREVEMMDAARRKMREDLEARERAGAAGVQRGVKRTWTTATAPGMGPGFGGDNDAEEKLQREIERIAEDGRRRRREAEERLRREMEEEERILHQEEEEKRRAADKSSHRVDRSQEGGGENIAMLERSVKVRWVKDGRGLELDKDRLVGLFAPFGKIENAFTLKDKKQRIGDRREKKLIGTGIIVYSSIVSAHTAVLDSEKKKRQKGAELDDWALIESVSWASGSPPDLGLQAADHSAASHIPSATNPPSSTPSKPTTTAPNKASFNFPGIKTSTLDGAGSKPNGKAPSFASFSPAAAAANSAKTSSSAEGSTGRATPSLEELTLMRLKSAQRDKERRALAEQLMKEDEAADAAEAAAAAAKAT